MYQIYLMTNIKNMSAKDISTTTEKIDYIFDYILNEEKKNRNKLILKWIFRLLIIWYILYVYLFLWPMAKDFYTKLFPFSWVSQTQAVWDVWGASWDTNNDIEIWSFKINKEKADQIRALFCK